MHRFENGKLIDVEVLYRLVERHILHRADLHLMNMEILIVRQCLPNEVPVEFDHTEFIYFVTEQCESMVLALSMDEWRDVEEQIAAYDLMA